MNVAVKRFYGGVFFLLISACLFMYFQFSKTENAFYSQSREISIISSESLNLKVSSWLDENIGVIDDLIIDIKKDILDEDSMETIFKEELKIHEDFLSIYYCSPENNFITGSDRSFPEKFDFRESPWYVQASSGHDFIITNPTESISGDKKIITLAKSMYDDNGSFLGVIGGDIALDTISNYIKYYNHIEEGYFFLIDSMGETIASNQDVNQNNDGEIILKIKEKINALDFDKNSKIEINSEKNSGFYTRIKVKNTNWHILGYIPLEVYKNVFSSLKINSYFLFAVIVMIFSFILYHHNRTIIKPLVALTNSIGKINLRDNVGYRIEAEGDGEFVRLVDKINNLLYEIEDHSNQIIQDRDEIHALNEEMEATIEQLVATEQEAISQKMNFESLFKYSLDAIVFFDNEHKVVDINKEFKRLFEYDIDEIRGMELDGLISGSTIEKQRETKNLTKSLFSGNDVDFESIRYGKNEKLLYVQIKGVPIVSDGYVIGGFGIYSDISKRKEKEDLLMYMGNHDHLTGAYNRKYFEEYIKDIESREIYPVSIVLADINGLRLINDAFGSSKGDELLKATCDMFKNSIYDDYVIARLSGDEFAIILENADSANVENFVKVLSNNVKNIKIDDVDLSVTFGWATKSSKDTEISSIIKDAEDYLYKLKLIDSPNARGNAINTIIDTLHEKNKREEQHSKRVSYLSYRFGKALGLPERELKILKTMGLLHDVGKIGIDEMILNKDGFLTEKEYSEIKKHPEIGYRILSSVNELSEIADYVLAHHERWDGKGYPRGLKGSEIPYLARIISITDSYDAMTSDRAYRKAKSREFAIKEFVKNAGTQFDPDLAIRFSELLEKEFDLDGQIV